MSKAHLRDFSLGRALYVCENLPDNERRVFEVLTGRDYDPQTTAAAPLSQPGMHFSWVNDEGVPVAAGGLIRRREGVMRTWFCATDVAWVKCGKELTASVTFVIKQALDTGLAHRIETLTLADQTKARRWYDRIGLQYEATLRGYCPTGEAAVLYSAVRNVESS